MKLYYLLNLSLIFSLFLISSALAGPKLNYKFLQVNNHKRSWWEYVPVQCANRPCPLLLAFHGLENSGDRLDDVTGFVNLSEKRKFIIVYPESLQSKWSSGADELSYVDNLLQEIKSRMKIDEQKIFAVGFSVGGSFVYRLACERSSVFAGIATVMANMESSLPDSCKPERPVPVINFVGTADRIMPMDGGEIKTNLGFKKLGHVLSTNETLNFWIRRNQCSPKPIVADVKDDDKKDDTHAVLEKYENCSKGANIYRWVIGDGGHVWPSPSAKTRALQGKVSREINASDEILNFLLPIEKKH